MNNYCNRDDMMNNLKKISPIWGIVIVFFVYKMNHLFIPYFWDELGVYTRAALYMYDHQIGLLPSALPPELSRGHPLLFTVIFAYAYKILGPHVWAGHLVAILFSCGLLFVLFKIGVTYFNKSVAIIGSMLLMVQPVFIAQSSMVLPEIVLSFFCLLSLHSYLRGNYKLLALYSTMAILVKEPAIALPCIFLLAEFYKCWREGRFSKTFYKILMIIMPILVWLAFLVIQKYQNGWYFFPLHADYVSFSLQSVIARLGYYLSFLVKGQGRYVWGVLFVIFMIRLIDKDKREYFKKMSSHIDFNSHEVFALFGAYIVVFFMVLILNFHLARYILVVMPVACLVVAVLTVFILKFCEKSLFKVLIILSLILPSLYLKGNHFNVDADLGYLDIVKSQKEMTSYLSTLAQNNSRIYSAFPINFGLTEKRSGYSQMKYTNVSGHCYKLNGLRTGEYLFHTQIGSEVGCKVNDGMVLIKQSVTPYSKIALYTAGE